MKIALTGRKILFATVPGDGHVNPLTGLAVYLKEQGCDVRWYTSENYGEKIRSLGIQLYPFQRALDVSAPEFQELMPERNKRKSKVAKLKWDLENVFIKRSSEYYEDLRSIHKVIPFEVAIVDCTFMAIPFIKHLMKIPVINIGVLPLIESSKDLAPTGLGLTPAQSLLGKFRHYLLRMMADKLIFGSPNKALFRLLDAHRIPHNKESVFDMVIQQCDVMLQSGTPGFEYERSDLSSHIRFIGPLLPYSSPIKKASWFDLRLTQYKKIVLVTQGTVEKDVNKIIVPTLQAFKGTDVLVIATTGGSQTAELKQRFADKNFIIEDFISFKDVMPYANLYITNGGYGGVLLGIQHNLPLVVAGVHEGKNEIAARIGYFKLGINLKTETPTASAVRAAVKEVLRNQGYKQNVLRLADEFRQYNPNEILTKHLVEVLNPSRAVRIGREKTAK